MPSTSPVRRGRALHLADIAAEANITTCSIFAPSAAREHLIRAGDPILSQTNAPAAPAMEPTRSDSSHSVSSTSSRVNTGLSAEAAMHSSARDAIIVCADDSTGVLRVYRNSRLENLLPMHGAELSIATSRRSRANSLFVPDPHES